MKSNLLLYSLYYAEECKGLVEAHIRFIVTLGNTAALEEMSQRW